MAELWLPEQVKEAYETGATAGPLESAHTLVVNETDLPDDQVKEAVAQHMTETYFQENASLAGMQSTFQMYVNDGSLLARSRYRTPTNVIEEMKLARDLAERDDDIRACIGGVLALAFEHVENYHEDKKTTDLFNGISHNMDLIHVLKEMLREWLITSNLTTVTVFSPVELDYEDDSAESEGKQTARVSTPMVGVLPAENVRVIGSDLFRNAPLAYWPGDDPKLSRWLEEFFSDFTTAARKAEMRRQDPISAAMFTAPVQVQDQQSFLPGTSVSKAYLLNPTMVARSTMPKGHWPYARPLMTSNFALLEAKRLLNIMDFALLQGGANFIVVAKKGTDERPALPQEITQLREMVRHVGRTGVIIGDHRLSFDILTPKLEEMLNPVKRSLVGRKIAMGMLRKPENLTLDGASASATTEIEWISRVITDDRGVLKRHIEQNVWRPTAKRNPTLLADFAKLWFPKIILQGSQFFTDFVLKLRDRGDIPRRYAVQAAGFDFDAAVAEREREVEDGIDEIMQPAAVPYTVPAGVQDKGPPTDPYLNDNNPGRPRGTSPNNGRGNQRPGAGRDPFAPRTTVTRNAGETIKAWREPGVAHPVRMGELTRALLEQYRDTAETGRITAFEERALSRSGSSTEGPVTLVRVNEGYQVDDVRAVRLTAGFSAFIGRHHGDGALVTTALGFREPEYSALEAQETAIRYGFDVAPSPEAPQLEERAAAAPQAPVIVIERDGEYRTVVERDEHGNIVGTRRVPLEPEGGSE